LKPLPQVSLGNGKREWATVEVEQQARQAALEEQLRVYRSLLPGLLKRLGKIRDPRKPKTLRHKLTLLMLYGILTFVFHLASRREANWGLSRPMFQQNLRLLFPELDSLPHQDTLNRLLARVEVEEMEATLVDLMQRFIRKQKLHRYLVSNCYPVAMDGSQKLARAWRWNEECLERQVTCRTEEGGTGSKTGYYVYLREANLGHPGGAKRSVGRKGKTSPKAWAGNSKPRLSTTATGLGDCKPTRCVSAGVGYSFDLTIWDNQRWLGGSTRR
jgi:hypothetical protein